MAKKDIDELDDIDDSGKQKRNRSGKNKKSKIDAYIMTTDPLNNFENNVSYVPDVNGTRHYVKPPDVASIFNGHSMDNMLKIFGINPTKYNIPKPPIPPNNWGIDEYHRSGFPK